jgi:hypothetical protein
MLLNISLQLLCTDHAENTASIIKEACLLIRCSAMDVLLLSALAPAGMCLPSRCLAAVFNMFRLASKETVASVCSLLSLYLSLSGLARILVSDVLLQRGPRGELSIGLLIHVAFSWGTR